MIKNIEKLRFWAVDDSKIQFAKGELLSQIKYLDMSISAKGFFTINRQLMASVICFQECWRLAVHSENDMSLLFAVGGRTLHLHRDLLSVSPGYILV